MAWRASFIAGVLTVCAVQVVVGVPFEVSRLVLEGWRHHAAGRPTMTHMRQVLERVLAHDVPESDNVDNGDGKGDDHT